MRPFCSRRIVRLPPRSAKAGRLRRRPNGCWIIIISSRSRSARFVQDLPPGFYRQLPKLADGPLAGYPRVFGLAWAFIAHSDSRFDPDSLRLFVRAYQRVQPLTIGELWAVAITLRIVLVENLRRAAARIVGSRAARQEADSVADRLLGVNGYAAEPDALLRLDATGAPLPAAFAVQLVLRLRDQDPTITPARRWLDERLSFQGTTADEIVHEEHQRQGTSNVTVRNIITSMRLLSDLDWPEFFESVSLVDELLRSESGFAAMDFASRDLYRRAIEQLARGSKQTEIAVAQAALSAGRSPVEGGTEVTADRRHDPGYHLIGEGRRAFEASVGFRISSWRYLRRFRIDEAGDYICGHPPDHGPRAISARDRVALVGPERMAPRTAGASGTGAIGRRGYRRHEPRRHARVGRDDSARPGAARRDPAASSHDDRGARTADDSRGHRGTH